MFFLISGFLLYRPFVAARLRGEPMPFVGAYAWRRFLRIVPAYWVALTATALLLRSPRSSTKTPCGFYAFGRGVQLRARRWRRLLAVAWSCVRGGLPST